MTIEMVTGMAESRDWAVYLVVRCKDRRIADRVLDMAWMHSQVLLRNSMPAKLTRNCILGWRGR